MTTKDKGIRLKTTVKEAINILYAHYRRRSIYCDTCGQPMTKRAYRRGKGLCYDCIEAIN